MKRKLWRAAKVGGLVRTVAILTALGGGMAVWQAALAAPAAGTSVETSNDPFVSGYLAYKAGALDTAIAKLSVATRQDRAVGDYALYYLAQAEFIQHDLEAAGDHFQHLADLYPQSIFRAQAELKLAAIALTELHYQQALQKALLAGALSDRPALASQARLIAGQARIALGQLHDGYAQLQTVRREFPRSAADAQARQSVSTLLAAHPELVDMQSLAYLRGEAELLLSEGQTQDAYEAARAGLRLAPPGPMRAELLWAQARALRGQSDRERQALEAYLAAAPAAPETPAALYEMARLYWHQDNPTVARQYFQQVASRFPHSSLAPAAMLRMGRTFEDEQKLDAARTVYRTLATTYPDTEPGADGRFRSAWMLYLERQFGPAAAAFEVLTPQAAEPAERDMYRYWQARALEQSGQPARAHAIFAELADSIETNYYPELARRRIAAELPLVPPAAGFDPPPAPAAVGLSGFDFHLGRARALKSLGLDDLAAGELRRLMEIGGEGPAMRGFLLGEFTAIGDFYDAAEIAARMAAHGELPDPIAQRIRYPRAYWPQFSQAASVTGLKPDLLLALARQESLFDPAARSGSDARGLMQLLPSTAEIVAGKLGLTRDGALDLYDPDLNIRLGSANLQMLVETFNGNLFKAVAAYNAGEEAVRRWDARFQGPDDEWVENIDYNETRGYVKRVIGGMREYQMLYPGSTAAAASLTPDRLAAAAPLAPDHIAAKQRLF